MYDIYSLMNAEREEDQQKEGLIEPIPVNYLVGTKSCIPENIIGYFESYHKGQDPQDVIDNGFPCTLVSVLEGQEIGQYECIWNIKKFEAALDKRFQLI